MDKLTVELSTALVDNPATWSAHTKVEVSLQNSSGRLDIADSEGNPRSVHRFTIKDASDLGCGNIHNLTPEQAALVLATACSLTNPRILFSTLQSQFLPATMKLANIPSKVEVVGTPGGKQITITASIRATATLSTLLITQLILDETKVFDVISKLLNFGLFNEAGRSNLELNVLESLKRYREALLSAEGLSCYKSLYSSLEKAVNADQDRRGPAFDAEASARTGLPGIDFESLRKFNNRVKHVIRNRRDFVELKAGEARLAELAQNLKRATDSAILSRI